MGLYYKYLHTIILNVTCHKLNITITKFVSYFSCLKTYFISKYSIKILFKKKLQNNKCTVLVDPLPIQCTNWPMALKPKCMIYHKKCLPTNCPKLKRIQKIFKIWNLNSLDPDSWYGILEMWDHFFLNALFLKQCFSKGW